MRAAPAFQISLRRSGAWRVAAFLVVALGLGALTAWVITLERPVQPVLLIGAVVLGVAVIALGAGVARVPAVDLRFDGRCWYLAGLAGSSHRAGVEAMAGDLHIAIDFGTWMLLRFVPMSMAGEVQRQAVWLPAQRCGAENQWHAFRVSVHAPRQAPNGDTPVAF